MTTCINLVIPTMGRPHLLNRLLKSVNEDLLRCNLAYRILVVDQSVGHHAKENLKVIQRIKQKSNGTYYYLGLTQKTKILAHTGYKHLFTTEHLIPDPTMGMRFGDNRNWGRLFFAGSPYVSIDDDVIIKCFHTKLLRHRNKQNGIPWSLLFYNNMEELIHEMTEATDESLLKTLFNAAQSDTVSNNPCFATCGVAGHSGIYTHAILPEIGCRLTRNTVLTSDLAFRSALKSTSVVRLSFDLRTGPLDGFMTTIYSFNNYKCTIPFMPFGRGEDYIMSLLLKRLGYSPVMYSIPLIALHLPSPTRVPQQFIDVRSISSLITAVISRLDCSNLSVFFNEINLILYSKNTYNLIVEIIRDYAENIAMYYETVASQPDLCRSAFSTATVTLCAWKRFASELSNMAFGNHTINQIKLVILLFKHLIALMESWSDIWMSALNKRNLIMDICEVH